jgi:hypothetical protein
VPSSQRLPFTLSKKDMPGGRKTHTLKRMAFQMKAPIKLAKMMFALGGLSRRASGIIGRLALDSTHRQLGKQTATMTKETMIRG